jgi:hypothetical protein
VAGSGFRDFTRIAQSDPELWGDILTANRKALAAPLARAQEALAELARLLEANDGDEVERRIAAARAALVRISMSESENESNARGRRGSPPAAGKPEPSAASRRGGRGRRSNEPQ